MGKWIYRKPEPTNVRGICVICNTRLQKKVGSQEKYKAFCSLCDDKRFDLLEERRAYQTPYYKYKKDYCERCKFKAVNKCQLDVHHKDRNHGNNDLNNLETLCANCHRLEHSK